MKRIIALAGLLSFLVLWACHLGPEDDRDTFDIEGDAAWTECDTVTVVLMDGEGNPIDTLYDRPLSSLENLRALDGHAYQGGTGSIHIKGKKDGGLCFEQKRNFGVGGKGIKVDTILDPAALPTAISVKPESLVLTLESPAANLSAMVVPAYANPDFIWSLDDTSVVALENLVSGKGNPARVKPLKPGKAVITVRSAKDTSKSFQVSVRVASTEGGIKISKDPVVLYEKGPSDSLSVAVPEGYAGQKVEWKTGNNEIAIIDGQGRIKPLKAGQTFVQATLSPAGLSDVAVVLVKLDAPVLKVASKPGAAVNDTLIFSPTATQEFGALVLYRWDFTNDGIWDDSLTTGWSGTEVHLPAVGTRYAKEGSVTARFQVKDSEGNTGEALVVLDIGNQSPEILARVRDTVITIKDSLSMTATVRDLDGKVAWVGWDYEGDGRFDDSIKANDTLVKVVFVHTFVGAGPYAAVLKAVDGNGKVRLDTARIKVELDAPTADAGPDITVLVGAPVIIAAKGADKLGKIVKVEVKIGDGTWNTLPKTDTAFSFTAPTQPGLLKCVVRVTDDDSLTAEDAVEVTVMLSSNADLSDLILSAAPLAPTFNPNSLSYAARVAFADSLVTVTAKARDAAAKITVNAKATASGVASDPVKLQLGSNANAFQIIVTAADGVQRIYSVSVVRDPNGEATLSKLEAPGFTLLPAFSATTLEYADTVFHSVETVTFKPTVASVGATLSFNDTAMTSGTFTAAQTLQFGENHFRFNVKAQDDKSNTLYQVRILRLGRIYVYRKLDGAAATLSDSADVAVGSSLPLTVAGGPAYRFVKWSLTAGAADIADSAANTTTVTVKSGVVKAQGQFEILRHTVTVSSKGCGTVTPGTTTFDQGLSPSFKIETGPGCRIQSVKVDNAEDTTAYDGSHAFPSISASHTLAAVFVRTYSIKTTVGANGKVSLPNPLVVDSGSKATLTFTPDPNYKVTQICDSSWCGVKPVNTYTIDPVLMNHSIMVSFARAVRMTGSVGWGIGAITPLDSLVDSAGTAVWRFAPTNKETHRFDFITDNDKFVSPTDKDSTYYALSPITAAHHVKVHFRRKFLVTVEQPVNGTASPGTGRLDSAQSAAYTITPSGNYRVDTVWDNNTPVSTTGDPKGGLLGPRTYTLGTIGADHTIRAKMRPLYKIDAMELTTGGTITPDSVMVDSAGSQAFTITPSSGYALSGLTYKGVNVLGQVVGNVFTAQNVVAYGDIYASFALVPKFTITLEDSLLFAGNSKYNPSQFCASYPVTGGTKDTCANQKLVLSLPQGTSLWFRGSDAVMDCSGVACTNAIGFAYWETTPGFTQSLSNPRTITVTGNELHKAVYRNDM